MPKAKGPTVILGACDHCSRIVSFGSARSELLGVHELILECLYCRNRDVMGLIRALDAPVGPSFRLDVHFLAKERSAFTE